MPRKNGSDPLLPARGCFGQETQHRLHGRIALPRKVRDELGLREGDIELNIVDGVVVIRPVVSEMNLPADHVDLPPLTNEDVEVMRRSVNR
jgi:AbrB family looped-hinge helix DNA binding protein